MFTIIKSLQPYSDGSYEFYIVNIDDIYYMIHNVTLEILPTLGVIRERDRKDSEFFCYRYGKNNFVWNSRFFYRGEEDQMRYDPIEGVSYSSSSLEHCIGDELALMEFLSKIGGE